MSDFPVEGEALRYGLRVLAAAKEAVPTAIPWYTSEEARRKAAIAAQNRGDNDCRTVLAASYKVAHEINRLMGFLRFKPDAGGYYVARCSPDHFILPVLEPHFTRRFGDTPWAVVDEKRGLALVREGQDSRILLTGEAPLFREGGRVSQRPEPQNRGPWTHDPWAQDPWEELWQSYHRTISIGVRKNPALQRRFIPQRYRDYLNEFNDPPVCSAGTEDPSGSRQPES
jgi:probable DNA metabolism protein